MRAVRPVVVARLAVVLVRLVALRAEVAVALAPRRSVCAALRRRGGPLGGGAGALRTLAGARPRALGARGGGFGRLRRAAGGRADLCASPWCEPCEWWTRRSAERRWRRRSPHRWPRRPWLAPCPQWSGRWSCPARRGWASSGAGSGRSGRRGQPRRPARRRSRCRRRGRPCRRPCRRRGCPGACQANAGAGGWAPPSWRRPWRHRGRRGHCGRARRAPSGSTPLPLPRRGAGRSR